jgi:two-component system capsular synthesis response regulator RcsB
VHAAFANSRYVSPTIEKILRTLDPIHRDAPGNAQLTGRELEVIRLYVSGMTINEIAARLNRSKKTISTQKSSAMRKLNIDREVDLFHYGVETGLIPSVMRPAR